jgi:subtilisin family serine protease
MPKEPSFGRLRQVMKGDFECLKTLVWSGAQAGWKSPQGRIAKDFLDRKGPDFVACNLLLRCYAYLQEQKRPRRMKASGPSLVVVSDNFVDHEHPRLKNRYHVNAKERDGRNGLDDDGNGFVDDIYGWNFVHKGPPRAPRFSLEESAEDRLFLRSLVQDMRKFSLSTSSLERSIIRNRLSNQARNSLVQQVGPSNLAKAGFILDDFKFYEMWTSASHGTHVAGTVLDASDDKARVTSATHGVRYSRKAPVVMNPNATISLATKSASYAEFLEKVIMMVRSEGVAYGVQASRYLQQLGAGVVNMSWGKPLKAFRESATKIEEI